MRDPVRAWANFSGPTIAAVNGVAITGGFELALACDVLIGSPNARFADTHARVGILPGWGLSQRLSRLLGRRAPEISLTGNFVDAEQACAWGLINRIVPEDELIARAFELAEDMLSCLPDALVQYKALIDDGYATNFGESLELKQAAPVQPIGKCRGQRGRTPPCHSSARAAKNRRLICPFTCPRGV